MTFRGRDVTAEWARRSCLVIAPHPDDETLGCGATIARKIAAGAHVSVLIATDGRNCHPGSRIGPTEIGRMRTAEAAAACSRLGLPDAHLRQLCWEDSVLAEREDELAQIVLDLISDVRPDDVLVTSAKDWHPDHQAVSRAARVALAGAGASRSRLFEYPVWHWAEGPWLRHGRRPVFKKVRDLLCEPWETLAGARPQLVATGAHRDQKREALACYRSQIENLTGESTWAVLDDRFLAAFLRRYELFTPAD